MVPLVCMHACSTNNVFKSFVHMGEDFLRRKLQVYSLLCRWRCYALGKGILAWIWKVGFEICSCTSPASIIVFSCLLRMFKIFPPSKAPTLAVTFPTLETPCDELQSQIVPCLFGATQRFDFQMHVFFNEWDRWIQVRSSLEWNLRLMRGAVRWL